MFYPWKAVDRQPKAYVPFKTFCQRTFLLYFNKVENVMLWVEQNLTKLRAEQTILETKSVSIFMIVIQLPNTLIAQS